jgi:crotonobetainyl-CoA:carnitine CoA-transferase CaiB-like acyl-CoA transferase
VAARGLVYELPLGGDLLRLVGPPVQFAERPARVRTPPPRLGEHTEAVLGDLLGMDAAQIAALRGEGVL